MLSLPTNQLPNLPLTVKPQPKPPVSPQLYHGNRLLSTEVITVNNFSLTADNIKKLSMEERETLVPQILEYFRTTGFPYYFNGVNDLIQDWNALQSFNPQTIISEPNSRYLINTQSVGRKLFKHFATNYYQVTGDKKTSLIDAFNRDDLLISTIRNRLGFSKSGDVFNFTGNMLIQGLRNSFAAFAASIFNASIAKFIYETFAPEDGYIFDYSVGFGQRMLAALSSKKRFHYCGTDPWTEAIANNNQLLDFINQVSPTTRNRAKLFCQGSEVLLPLDYWCSFDLAFSSPPYFNLEQYSTENTQAYHNHNYHQFIHQWWRQTCHNITCLLKPGGYFCLNMMEQYKKYSILSDMLQIAHEFHFQEVDRYYIKLNRNINFRKRQGKEKVEPIVILQRKK